MNAVTVSILGAAIVCVGTAASAAENRPPAPPEDRVHSFVQPARHGGLQILDQMGLSVRSDTDFKYEETLDLGLVDDQDGVGRRYFYFDAGKEIRVVASFRRSANSTPVNLDELAKLVVEKDAAGFVSKPATTEAFLGLPSAISSGTAGNHHISVRVFWHPAMEHFVVIAALSKTGLVEADMERQEFEASMKLTSE